VANKIIMRADASAHHEILEDGSRYHGIVLQHSTDLAANSRRVRA
jgi:hypothetical protein